MGNIFGNKKQATRITEQDKAVLVSYLRQQKPLIICMYIFCCQCCNSFFSFYCIATKAAARQTETVSEKNFNSDWKGQRACTKTP